MIQNSYQTPCIAFSAEVSDALMAFKAFNLERIYLNPVIKKPLEVIERLFAMLFEQYLSDLRTENRDSVIYSSFFAEMSSEYITHQSAESIVRDFIAGMTDQYFLRQCPENLRPRIVSID
jgi:dGTPase